MFRVDQDLNIYSEKREEEIDLSNEEDRRMMMILNNNNAIVARVWNNPRLHASICVAIVE